jgi:hypothetical protein
MVTKRSAEKKLKEVLGAFLKVKPAPKKQKTGPGKKRQKR